MIFPVSRCALRCLHRPGGRTFPTSAMEVAFRGVRKVLCVAEKNDAAKGIADLLSKGRMRRREGLSKFNKIYEFDYHLCGQNVTMIMTSVSGHLLAHDFQMQFRKWQSCNPLVLFEAEIEKYCPENFVDIKKTLERETRLCQALVIWTDCDREGENIGFEIIHVCKAVKPSLQVWRARFSEITPRAVTMACENLTQPDQRVSDAVDVRQELDLRIGAAFTRFQTLRLQKIFPQVLAEQLISYGSCQFPTLGFVVERFKAIQAFVPEIFHRIKVTHDHRDGVVEFSWKRHRLFNHTACLVLYQLCMEDPRATVVEVSSKAKSKWRPQALDTVELEKLASRKLRISAKETMRIAEKLYTQGYISYPRTETNIFPRDLNLTALVEQQTPEEAIYPAVPAPVRKCPQCNKDMVLKTKKSGGFYLSCTGFPECRSVMWLPDFVLEACRDESVCPVCQPHPVHRLKLKCKRGSLPPTMPLEFIGCIGGCDETLREILNLRFSQGPPRACPPASQPPGYLQAGQSLNRMDSSQHSHPLPPDTRQPRPLKALARNLPPATAAGENDSVVCNCGQEAVLLTVRKEGPNQGRQFYKCPAGSCSFFLWASGSCPDPPSSAPRPPGGSLGRPPGSGNRPGGAGGPGDDSGGGTSCLCSQAAVTRTVQKDGPNKGRQFHTCAKPRAQQCGFFQWVDENVAPGASGAVPWPGGGGNTRGPQSTSKRARASSSDPGSTAKKPRKCSLCHQPGHTRPFCPQGRGG
uniref:DNA topoisomerase n=1 Tax=Myotis myotis TaxID=51298 RepID=A0A7J7RE26_MYOMY|nr:DNA topoisomerase III alpha [Myotis myotis]